MTEIQQGRYDALLRRVADLKGPGSKVNDVLEELFPCFNVEELPAELYRLANIDLCMGGGRADGGIGTSGRGQIFNPAGSGKILTVTQAGWANSNTGFIRWGRRDTPLTGNLSTQIFVDVRHPLGNLPTGQIRNQASVAQANANGQTKILGNTPFTLTNENGIAVLTEGTGFEIGTDLQFETSNFYFYWRERVAEPSEVNF